MRIEEKTLEIYKTADEKAPFIDWMDALDANTQTVIETRLNRIRLGNLGDVKRIGSGVHEFRIDYGSGYRVYFGNISGKIIMLLVGGEKNTQQKDIRKAQECWRDFKERTKKK